MSNPREQMKSDEKRRHQSQRTFEFAKEVRIDCKQYLMDGAEGSDIDQAIRSSGSIGANYLEANDALSKKDFIYRLRVSRKEAKECLFWLKLIHETNKSSYSHKITALIIEADEIKRILSAIILKSGG